MQDNGYRIEKFTNDRGHIKYRVKHHSNIIAWCDSELDALAIAGLLNQATPVQKSNARYEQQRLQDGERG